MFATLPIIISLILLMYFAYRGWSVLILAPLMAALAVILSGEGMLLLPAYTETFMKALGGYLLKFFPVFLLGALFGQLMADSGAATSIANTVTKKLGASRAILVVVLVCGILTYGGVSLFVVAFSIYPISKALFRQANMPKRLIPACIALGSFTFTMTALPGTPAIQNAIPIPYYQTNAFSAPILGLIGGGIMFVLGTWWLQSRARIAKKMGEGYGAYNDNDDGLLTSDMPFVLAIIPLVLVIGINALLTYAVFPGMDFGVINDRFPELAIKSNLGLWSIIIALLISCLVLVLLNLKHLTHLQESVNKGVYGSMLPIFNTASEVGYGAVIATMAGFAIIRDNILSISPDNPLVSEAVAMSVLAGITGSSSGGLSIALQTLGEDYLKLAIEHNVDPELLHRIAVMAAGGLDTLPHSGAVITLFAICHLTHKQSYMNLAVVTIAIPIFATISVIILGTLFGSF
ncbi:GntP family permease [Moraxella haemolytica]|uniref:GntP family permease n=1 Tax=Moraxella TaxID=475 RepID=UPI002542D50A|nr:GntP family permease [Moraxella sp. ZY171148]WII95140.1 GntP family permease [Moraxella sp. ZY171148]